MVAEGRSNEEIADALVLSVRTVERHLSNSYAKLRVSGKAAARRGGRALCACNPTSRRLTVEW